MTDHAVQNLANDAMNKALSWFFGGPNAGNAEAEHAIRRGNTFLRQGDYDSAIRHYAEAIRRNPRNANAYNNRGAAHMYKRDYAAAIEDFSEAIQIDANNAMAYANRGYAWSVQNSFDKAVSDFTEVIRLEPNDAYAFEGRGFAWAKIGVFDKSLADCTETIRLSPSKSSAYVSRGYAWTMMGEFENSIDDFTEAIRLDPIDASAYVSRGYSWWKAGNNAAALQDYGEAIRLNAEDASAYNNFAWLVSTCPIAEFRDGSKGLDYATKACELSNWETWYNIGTLAAAYAEIEQWENAVKWQKLAITLATDEKDKQGGRDRLELYKSRKPYREQPATVKDIALFK